jgi:hypothetical protein
MESLCLQYHSNLESRHIMPSLKLSKIIKVGPHFPKSLLLTLTSSNPCNWVSEPPNFNKLGPDQKWGFKKWQGKNWAKNSHFLKETGCPSRHQLCRDLPTCNFYQIHTRLPIFIQSCKVIPSLIKWYPISLTFWFCSNPIGDDEPQIEGQTRAQRQGDLSC